MTKVLETMVPKSKPLVLDGVKRIASFDVPEELWEVLVKDAEKQRRTVRAQILFILEQHYTKELENLKIFKP